MPILSKKELNNYKNNIKGHYNAYFENNRIMKTKDFIRMLEKADPTGEGYIRLPGSGAPYFAEVKEGYWDGPYEYLQLGEEKKYYPHDSVLVTSTRGYKVDIHVLDTDSIIWDEDGDIEKIKKRISFDYDGYGEDSKLEKTKKAWENIEKEAKTAREYHAKSLLEWTEKVVTRYFSDSWEVRQPLDKEIGWANCMTAHSTGFLGIKKDEKLCQGECEAIIESGKFYPEKTSKYYIWKYNPEKGQNWSPK